MAPRADPTSVCAELLAGVDSDTLEYITGGVVDADTGEVLELEEFLDFVAPLVSEQLCAGDEAKAKSLAATLHDRLAPAKPAVAVKAAKPAAPAAALGSLLSLPREEEEEQAAPEREAKKPQKASKADARAAKAQAAKQEAVAAQVAQLEAEMEAARERAVRLRWTKGRHTGAIELGPFALPNPGGGPDLLEDCAFTMVPGRRYGLIGRNGKGKTTLLRHLASGGLPEAVTVHYVSQEAAIADLDQMPAKAVVAADVERRLLLRQAEEAQAEQLQACLAQLQAIDADSAEERAEQLLTNLGFSAELRARRLSELSGGWRVRVALAAALFARPDVLLLDEPTNHLSIQAVLWLGRELSTGAVWRERMVVVVSHDRVFLDEACTDTLHLSGAARRLTPSRGSYSLWAKRREQQQLARERQLETEAAEAARLKEYVGHGFKYGGSSGQINMQQKMKKQLEKAEAKQAEEAQELAALNEDVELPLKLHAGGALDGPVVQLRNVSFGYAGASALFRHVELSIDGRSRIVLVGENGNGKSTLVKLMLGELEPSSGSVQRSRGARLALVSQHHAEQLDLAVTPLEFMLARFPGDGSYEHEQALRGHLSQCGCEATQQGTRAGALSGGQRSRVAMAAVSWERPHMLLMDEPTNNLDLTSVEALAESVKRFEGAVVLVSHDQHFVSQVAEEVWVVAEGAVKRVESFDAYRAGILAGIKRS